MISLIVAFGKDNRVIGNKNKIPWHIKEDFQHFKAYTTGKTILMGDMTFYSIGKPLSNRKTIVATQKDFTYDHEDVSITHDLFATLEKFKDTDEELIICGGATIYKLSLPYVQKAIISEVKKHYDGDAFFPVFENEFDLISVEEKEEFVIKTYLRRNQKHD